MTAIRLQDRAVGKWAHILPAVGMPAAHLTGRHGPCPMCGGSDRFRFDNKGGKGTFYCSQCGSGTGVELVMRFLKVPFPAAAKEIERHLPDAPIVVPRAKKDYSPVRLERQWQAAQKLTGDDLVSCYLAQRGIVLPDPPGGLRLEWGSRYYHEDKSVTEHPTMLARMVGVDGGMTLHMTYLDEELSPETKGKARVPSPRLNAKAKFPDGGAVRLFPAAEVMGIAEGIETALSAWMLFGVPVWAALSTSGLVRWQPPAEARRIIIFGDADRNYAGQHAAYALAQKLTAATYGYEVDVEIPHRLGNDWNDVLVGNNSAGVAQ